jgi:osmotically-inducible protein OsmY
MSEIVNEFAEKLQEKIQENEGIKNDWGVEVFEENGVVTLSGSVPSEETYNKVEKFVRQQEGVKEVINEMDLDASLSESDKNIVTDKEDYVPAIRDHPE